MILATAPTRYYVQVVFGGIAMHASALFLPLFMMQLYDRILPNGALATLTWLAGATLVALALEAVLKVARARWASWNTEVALFRNRRELLETLLSFPQAGKSLREVFPALRTLISDSFQHYAYYLSEVPFGVLYLGMIYLIHPLLALLLVVLGTILMTYLAALRPRFQRLKKERDRLKVQRQDLTNALFGSMAELKALGAEEQLVHHVERVAGRMRRNDAELAGVEMQKLVVGKLLDNFSVFLPLLVGGIFVIQGELTVGSLTACMLLARRSLGPIHGAAERWYGELELLEARRLLEPYRQTKRRKPAAFTPPPKSMPVLDGPLAFSGLALRAGIDPRLNAQLAWSQGSQQVAGDDEVILAVEDVTLQPGTLVCFPRDRSRLTGDLLEVIRGTNPFFSGEIGIAGFPLSQVNRSLLAQGVALVKPAVVLFPGTYLENLALFDQTFFPRAQQLAKRLGLDTAFEGLERGYETPVSEVSVSGLPPGVLQRIALVRALVPQPLVLLLDRFDDTLDQVSRQLCRQIVTECLPTTVVLYHGDDPLWHQRATLNAVVDGNKLAFHPKVP